MSEYPSYSAAAEEAEEAVLADRPLFAQQRWPIDIGSGHVDSVDTIAEATNGGGSMTYYRINVSKLVVEKAVEPQQGSTTSLMIASPYEKAAARNRLQQPYFWTLEGPRAQDPDIDSLKQLEGRDIHFELKSRKAWETKQYPDYYYEISLAAGSNGANGAKPTTPISEAALDQCILFLDGKNFQDFARGVSRDEAVRAAATPDELAAIDVAAQGTALINIIMATGKMGKGEDGVYRFLRSQ